MIFLNMENKRNGTVVQLGLKKLFKPNLIYRENIPGTKMLLQIFLELNNFGSSVYTSTRTSKGILFANKFQIIIAGFWAFSPLDFIIGLFT